MVGYLQDMSDINKDETAGNNEKKPQTPERLYVDGYIFRRESRLCTEIF